MARILVISCTTYGQDSRVKRHAEALVGHADEVDVLCLENRRNVRSNGVNVIGLVRPRHRRTGTIRGLCYVQFSISAAFNAVRFSLRRRYDVVVVYAMRTATILCAAPLRLHGSRITLDLGDETAEAHQKEKAGRQGALRGRLLVMEEAIRARFANRVIVAHAIHRQLLRNLKIFGSGASNTTRIFSGIPACSEGCADSLGWDHQQRQLLEAIDSLLEKETEARPASESSSGVGAISARRSFRASEAVRWLSGSGMPVVTGGIVAIVALGVVLAEMDAGGTKGRLVSAESTNGVRPQPQPLSPKLGQALEHSIQVAAAVRPSQDNPDGQQPIPRKPTRLAQSLATSQSKAAMGKANGANVSPTNAQTKSLETTRGTLPLLAPSEVRGAGEESSPGAAASGRAGIATPPPGSVAAATEAARTMPRPSAHRTAPKRTAAAQVPPPAETRAPREESPDTGSAAPEEARTLASRKRTASIGNGTSSEHTAATSPRYRRPRYNIQIDAAMDRNGADSMAQRFQRLGYTPHLVPTVMAGQTWYKVEVGPYATQDEAAAAQEQLHQKYNSAYISH